VLEQAHGMTEPAEAHGTLAGALCAAPDYSCEDWLAEVLPEGPVADGIAVALRALYVHTRNSLQGTELEFALLIPDDDETLESRTMALGQWCNGFLYGLGSNGGADAAELPGDAGEVVRDLSEITRASVDPGENEEESEGAYAELVEFVRVGVQLLFEELGVARRPAVPAAPASRSLH
jgi:uncharacterized protein YgfB (UPF0149 family)